MAEEKKQALLSCYLSAVWCKNRKTDDLHLVSDIVPAIITRYYEVLWVVTDYDVGLLPPAGDTLNKCLRYYLFSRLNK